MRRFVHLMELHIRDHWTVGDYTAALDITADRLNTAIRRAAGRTPQDLIHARIMTEAATLLDSSPRQIGEIASSLGFRDAAYFSRFFKRLSGISPRTHRDGLSDRKRPHDNELRGLALTMSATPASHATRKRLQMLAARVGSP